MFSHGSDRSADVSRCLKKIVTLQSDAHGHWLTAAVTCEGIFDILDHIYGYNCSGLFFGLLLRNILSLQIMFSFCGSIDGSLPGFINFDTSSKTYQQERVLED